MSDQIEKNETKTVNLTNNSIGYKKKFLKFISFQMSCQ